MDKLFVYGTLLPGRENEHILGALSGIWVPGFVRAWHYPRGIGAAAGYPALVLDDSASWIAGQLFQSAELAPAWAALDEFEGPAYRRVMARVRREDESMVEAFVYELRPV